MALNFWPKGGVPGILHHYTESLVAFEYTSNTVPKPHSFVFVGGLGDGLATTSYFPDLVNVLQPTPWSVFTLVLSSSYGQWGVGHLDRDTDEIAQCLQYVLDLKSEKFEDSKIVLMGHSTGSQDVLHYLYRPNPHTSTPAFDRSLQHVKRPVLDGAIMQAPVSDREAVLSVLENGFDGKSASELQAVYDQIKAIAKDAALRNDQSIDTILPLSLTSQLGFPGVPISCRRFMSLASPESPDAPQEDDLFSSDLDGVQLSKTFWGIKTQGLLRDRLMILFSGADDSVPDWIDKEKLLQRWKDAADNGGEHRVWDDDFSTVIEGATHTLSGNEQIGPRKELVRRVLGYLDRLQNV